MYIKEKVGIELKEKISKKLVADISKWAFNVYLTEVAITPRLAYDMMIKTGELSSQQCAQLIYDKFFESIKR